MGQHEIELFCNSNYNKSSVDKISKEAGVLFDSKVEGVKYRESGDPVPPFIVKCARLPYLENAGTIDKTADSIAESIQYITHFYLFVGKKTDNSSSTFPHQTQCFQGFRQVGFTFFSLFRAS